MRSKLEKLFGKLKERYKIIVLRDDTFVEKIALKAPLWYLISWFLAFFFLLFFFVALLIKISSLKEYIIGDGNYSNRKELVEAYSRIDSLSQIANANDIYLNNLKGVLSGNAGESESEALARERKQDKEPVTKRGDIDLSEDEQILKDLLASGNGIQNSEKIVSERGISSYTFYSPVRGIVSSQYDAKTLHFATDIATQLNMPIKATLDGHVIFASFTPSTGYVIIVQHFDNLISVYKHCAVLLKKVGSFIHGGEVIAMVGNTGELSTGPHLHFELWHNGNPVNAENYITF